MLFFSIGFTLFASLLTCLCLFSPSRSLQTEQVMKVPLAASKSKLYALRIVLLGFVPSSLFLSSTLFITTDIASFPLLWVVPLALYLLSFIIVFSNAAKSWTQKAQTLHTPAVFIVIATTVLAPTPTFALVHFVCFFIIALSCHGRAANEKPDANGLTMFYFWLSVGGALGGGFNTLAPLFFNDIYEYFLVLVFSILLLPTKHALTPIKFDRSQLKKIVLPMLVFGGIVAYLWLPLDQEKSALKTNNDIIYQSRNFFGVSKVLLDTQMVKYSHGTTLHGMQPRDPARKLEPTSYYVTIDTLLRQFPPTFFTHPFGVIGMGAGTQACYGRNGQALDFFEIDPEVIAIAKNPDFFTYLRDCPPTIRIIEGDGRLQLMRQPNFRYQLLIVDAFSSDAIPMHMLTREAVMMYRDKLVNKTGVLAFNISNKHLELKWVVSRLAVENGLIPYYKNDKTILKDSFATPSMWMVMLPKDSPWADRLLSNGFEILEPPSTTPLWSDDYSNIFPAIKWR